MPNGNPRVIFFYHTLTLIKDSYMGKLVYDIVLHSCFNTHTHTHTHTHTRARTHARTHVTLSVRQQSRLMKRLTICVLPRNRQRKETRNSLRSVSIFSQNYTKSMFETPLLTYPEVLKIYRLVKIFPASMFFKRHSCHVKNSLLGHALLISVNDRVISALHDGFIFIKPRRCENFRIYSINLRCKPA